MTPGETSAHLSVCFYISWSSSLNTTITSCRPSSFRRPSEAALKATLHCWIYLRCVTAEPESSRVRSLAADITAAPRGGRANILTLPCFHRDQLQGVWEQLQTCLAESCLTKFFFFLPAGTCDQLSHDQPKQLVNQLIDSTRDYFANWSIDQSNSDQISPRWKHAACLCLKWKWKYF